MRGRSVDTRETIRRAAYSCFRDKGYHETSVDTICRHAGVSKGSFYYHYTSKQACFIDILDSWTREVISEVQKQFESATLAATPFEALKRAFRRENVRGRLIVPLWLEFTVLARREPDIQDVLARFYHRARLAIGEMLRPFVGTFIAPDEVDGLSSAILGVFIGVLAQELSDPEHTKANAASSAVLNVFGRVRRHADPTGRSVAARPARERPQRDGHRLSDADFESFVAPHDGSVRQCMAELRELVFSTAPVLDERLIRGWRVIAYDLDGLVCYLKPQRDHVDVGFYRGVDLADPDGFLTGRGKKVRHARVASDEIPVDVLRALVRKAVALQGA